MDDVNTPIRAGRREWVGLGVLAMAVLLLAVDATVLGLAVPALSADLAPSGAQLLWIVDIYSFVLAGLLVTMGTLGDRIGRRRLLLIGAAGFGVASAVAAFSSSAEMLIAARALLGLAGATIMPSTLSLIRNMFLDARQRTVAIGVWSAMAAAGAALGPVVGGFLLEYFWWGSVFLINLPIMAILLLVGPLLIPESRNPDPGRFDLASAALSLLAVLPVVYAVKTVAESGVGPVPVLCAAVGIAAGVMFVRRQRRLSHPMIDVTLFADRAFSGAVATNLLSVFALVGFLYFGAQYLQLVLGDSPLQAGLWLLPGMLASLVTSLLAARLVRRFPRHVLLGVALLVSAAGFAVLTGLGTDSPGGLLAGAFALIGAGAGVALTLTNDAIVTAVPAERAGAASAISETGYELGVALGTAVLGTVLNSTYRAGLDLDPALPPDVIEAAEDTLGSAAAAAARLPAELAGPLLLDAREAFTAAVNLTSAVGAAVLVVAAVQAVVLLRRAA